MVRYVLRILFLNQTKNIYKRFKPRSKITTDIDKFVEENIRTNKSFYSFLAEGILGLIFRDIYGYRLAKGVIDIGATLADSHTGVDACMYNLEHNIIVLGEAKFYESLSGGMNQRIVFAGFVLHSEADVSQYGNQDFYNKYVVSAQQLENNVCDSLKHNDIEGNYEIKLVHLPIKDKKSLILKMIETSKAKLRSM